MTVLLVTVTVGTPIAGHPPNNEAPLADAGLDQTVSLGSTVLLDATGSQDPDGEIAAYSWRITAPNGSVTSPTCTDCARTEFAPSETGTYAVRVTVTDDDGATSADTLYVNVTPGDSPSVSLTGPDALDTGTEGTYSAVVRRGGASLDNVRWRVDGTVVRSESITDDRIALERSFESRGNRSVTAVVVDESGQRDTATVTTRVASPTSPSPKPSDPVRTDPDPVVRGAELLTGTGPFTETYTVETRRDSSRVEQVSWTRDGESNGTTRELTADWEPGRHSLTSEVTYADGSSANAQFENGSTTVVVDPRPTASFRQIDNGSTLSGIVDASDANGNLQRVSVEVDGTRIREWDARDSPRFGKIYDRQLLFREDEVSLGTAENVTLVAVDARGQRFETTRNVTPRANPEIVRAEFVNGPVDSYHDRIEAERYAAHHVVEVDLDGASPGAVEVETGSRSTNVSEVDTVEFNKYRDYDRERGTLTVHTYWSGISPGNYTVLSDVEISNQNQINDSTESISTTFSVTPSPPEIRINITHGGYFEHIRDFGKVVDARDSFDPDGTEIKFHWGQGAQATTITGVGKFSSFRYANLTVRDDYGLESEIPHQFAQYYTPEITHVREVSQGPYNLTDSVRFNVYSDRFQFTKNLFHERHDVEVTAAYGVRLLEFNSNTIERREAETDPDIDQSGQQYVATVEVEAAALTGDRPVPDVTFYNPSHPQTTRKNASLTTDSRIFAAAEWERTNMTVEDLSYDVRLPYRIQRTVGSRERRNQLLEAGYRVDRQGEAGTEYVVEKREQVREAQYDEETQWYRTRTERNQFLEVSKGWQTGERDVQQRTRTTTETEWRNTRGGRGEFTGNTRRIQTEPAQYRTLRKYQYDTAVERTRTITETHTVSVPDPDGWGTVEHTYETTKEETYTTTVTRSYWSTAARGFGHSFTGETRRVENSPAEYTNQYQYSYQTEVIENVPRYSATRRIQTQTAKYEWQIHETLSDGVIARQMAQTSSDMRIGERRPISQWVLSKQSGFQNVTKSDYDNRNNVIRTRALVRGNVTRISEQTNGDNLRREYVRDFTTEYVDSGVVDPEEIKDELHSMGEKRDPCLPNRVTRCER
ncbi:PKD domain-containing protein [Halostella sp. JP-L12]|uniref:PKD domain-containing protein n=1 Tax=Halostella TaxID=1843185 RepID=UPI0013CED921|nr:MULTISPECIES: PKD domain-containing protein [Halostella]NHN49565.1 PKD domain-containing protein [Halostella sp. JP-L12]